MFDTFQVKGEVVDLETGHESREREVSTTVTVQTADPNRELCRKGTATDVDFLQQFAVLVESSFACLKLVGGSNDVPFSVLQTLGREVIHQQEVPLREAHVNDRCASFGAFPLADLDTAPGYFV